MTAAATKLKAREVMTPEPVCAEPSTRLRELARLFEEHEISGVPVVDPEGRVIGVVSKTDLIRRCSEGTREIPPAYLLEILSEQRDGDGTEGIMPEPLVCVQDFMTEDPVTVGPDRPVTEVARLMHEAHIHRVIVTDDRRFPLGIITSLDLLGALSR